MGRKALLPIIALTLASCGGGGETTTVISEPTPGQTTASTRPEGPGVGPGHERPVLAADAVRDLERFATEAPGEVGVAVSPLGGADPIEVGEARSGRAWSTMKVPLLVALIDRVGGEGGLSAEERSQAEAALTASDNEAALALFDRLGELEGGVEGASAAIEAVLRRSGDGETEVNTEPSPEGYTTFGQTIWPASAATLFFRALASGCLLGEGDTGYVLALMEDVVAGQRWGLGEAPTPAGAAIAFKGGWGPQPGGGYLVRQSGVVTEGDEGYALSVIAIPDDTSEASFEAGQEIVSGVAALVAEHASAGTEAAVTCGR